MPLNNRNKRASALGIDLNFVHIYPNPDGTISQLDRQQIAYKYEGISSSITPGGSTGKYRTLLGVGA